MRNSIIASLTYLGDGLYTLTMTVGSEYRRRGFGYCNRLTVSLDRCENGMIYYSGAGCHGCFAIEDMSLLP